MGGVVVRVVPGGFVLAACREGGDRMFHSWVGRGRGPGIRGRMIAGSGRKTGSC